MTRSFRPCTCIYNAHNCLEVLVIRGVVREIKQIAHELIGVKGVKLGKLVMTTTGEDL